MDAQSKVINTYELLETILSHLSAQDVLLVQRASTQFRLVIGTSLPLRQKLHFESDYDADLAPIRREPRFCQTFDAVGMGQSFIYGEINVWQAHASPSCASWRNLFPCQPPPDGILLGIPFKYTRRPMLRSREGARGITLGMIVDAVKEYGDEGFWFEGRKAKFYALHENKIPYFMSRYDCETVEV